MKASNKTTYSVVWAPLAQKDLDHIIQFVAAKESTRRARSLLQKIKSKATTLTHSPNRGRKVPELATITKRDHRELITSPYRIIYLVSENEVHVVAVVDGRRELQDLLTSRAMEMATKKATF